MPKKSIVDNDQWTIINGHGFVSTIQASVIAPFDYIFGSRSWNVLNTILKFQCVGISIVNVEAYGAHWLLSFNIMTSYWNCIPKRIMFKKLWI